jgi:hypothetical protein
VSEARHDPKYPNALAAAIKPIYTAASAEVAMTERHSF